MAMGLRPNMGPELCIGVTNVRDVPDTIFKSAYAGDVETVKYLLESGKASVPDVAAGNGHSALHYALFKSRFGVVKLLLRFGAEPYNENDQHE